MNEIIERIYIGSLDTVNALTELTFKEIRCVISLGCIPSVKDNDIKYHSFPELLDTPDSIILDIIYSTNQIISEWIVNASGALLIHCRYGQSRSAAVIAAYLISIGIELNAALSLLKHKHTSICINPGFLCQLKILSERQHYAVEYLLLNFKLSHSLTSDEFPFAITIKKIKKYCCSQCNNELGTNQDELIRIDFTEFLKEYLDPFWTGYIPILSNACRNTPSTGYKILRPIQWVTSQVHSSSPYGILKCINCQFEVGYWQEQGIALCGGYIQTYLFAIDDSKISCTRIRKRPVV